MIECDDDPRCLRLKTVVTATRKLTFYHGEEFGELYDLEKDPGELKNRWDEPEYLRNRLELTARLIDHGEPLERRVDRTHYA